MHVFWLDATFNVSLLLFPLFDWFVMVPLDKYFFSALCLFLLHIFGWKRLCPLFFSIPLYYFPRTHPYDKVRSSERRCKQWMNKNDY